MLDPPKVSSGAAEVGVPFNKVSPEFFGAFGIPIRGRNFQPQEAETEAPVVIVSETLARRLWPGGDALGKVLYLAESWKKYDYLGIRNRSAIVVGVAGDSGFLYNSDLASDQQGLMLYFPVGLKAPAAWHMAVRMNGDHHASRRALEKMVAAPGVYYMVNPLRDAADRYMYPFRALLAITGVLGILALLLTASGVYGVSSYAVAQRRKEFGIRIALGADHARLTGMVLRQSLRLAVIGAGIGAVAALAVAQLFAHSIRQIDVFDPGGYLGGVAVVIAAAVAAAFIPARLAVKVDPVVTLRCD
jgi:hypothetical protein